MKTGLAVGLNKGRNVELREKKPRQADKKGRLGTRTKFVRSIIREVAGFAPYEKRTIELLKNSRDKRAKRLAKKRLGTMKRAKSKIEELSNVIAEQRRH
ncbi:hypothetical protein MIR68_000953 [Amoeboaphelidium protococcarum]|nr:hypothetical protein MIR68_002634 [Amoeboaphelidium protococcarum]KAI3640075.1 hypothetical protein MIR68_000953 [Amoeboaphelidium protococcarum]KAI3653217.1 hypothetical protein MP228_002642 [Amoeboaphelidium protococcarum]KAI3653777.1 hypothetical protein MP228_001724 [Amoeboaphelidium protococcarum]